MRATHFISCALACVLVVSLTHKADARGAYRDGGYVTAVSREGNGEISAPIRRGRNSWQVQLPSGTWTDCRRSCEETLRVQTVDLFETGGRMVGYGTLQNQCGIFGCLEIHAPRD